uniref:Actin maturation protease n=1 Tax=Anolis carolinensis TaxID=28377 RepID=A0A803T645_ANOCA
MSEALEDAPAPPLPPMLPPPPPLLSPPATGLQGPQLLKAALEQTDPGDHDGIHELLKRRKASFSEHLKWLLFNNPVPSLIQEGPQCGLVALWMAGALLSLPRAVSFGRIVQVALERGYTAQGEMFSGALLGLKRGFQLPPCQEDKEIPGLFHASPSASSFPLDAVAETYLLSKQGKSCRYQLWSYTLLQESNAQLTDFSPKRAADGKVYIVPAGGVREGLCGKAVLLRPGGSEIHKPR